MDLTTRRGDLEGSVPELVHSMNGTEQLNGSESGDVTGEVASSKKTSLFSIRNLVGGDNDKTVDGNNANEG